MSQQSASAQVNPTTANGSRIAVVAVIAALGGFLFGYDTGVISGALPPITKEFSLDTGGQQLVTSAILIGCMIGALAASPLSERVGRRPIVVTTGIVFAIGAVTAAFSPTETLLIISRLVLGLGVGGASQIVPVYVSELAPARNRGRLVVVFQLMVTFGILIAYVAGFALQDSWRLMFGLGAIPAIILALGMLALPDSPRWLLAHRGRAAAEAALARVRGSEKVALEEMKQVEDWNANNKTERTQWRGLSQKWVRPALVAGIGIAILSQITGINAVIYYAPTILEKSGFGSSASLLTTIGVGAVNFLMVALGTYLVDRIGRRRLMAIYLPLAVLSLVVLGITFAIGAGSSPATQILSSIALVAFIAFNGGSISVVVWLYGPEVYPQSIRAAAAGLSTLAVWLFDLLVSSTTLSLTNLLGAGGTFWLFAVVNVIAWLFVLRYVPEPKGRSLEEIESTLKDGTFRSLR